MSIHRKTVADLRAEYHAAHAELERASDVLREHARGSTTASPEELIAEREADSKFTDVQQRFWIASDEADES
jgi:hypothetical protein